MYYICFDLEEAKVADCAEHSNKYCALFKYVL
jgi:hypothetical protein